MMEKPAKLFYQIAIGKKFAHDVGEGTGSSLIALPNTVCTHIKEKRFCSFRQGHSNRTGLNKYGWEQDIPFLPLQPDLGRI